MDFDSPDVEKDFPGLYASEAGRKSNESDFSDGGDHDKPSKKELLIGRRKDKKEKKDRGYAALEGESSPEEDTETKSPSKSKKTKSFKFPSKSKEKREKSRDKEKCSEDVAKLKEQAEREKKKDKEKEKKNEKEKEKKEKDKKEKHKEKDKEKEEKAKFKLESKEKLKDKEKEKSKEKEKDKTKEKDKDKIKEKDKDKIKEKDKDKKDKKVKDKVQPTVTSGIPFEEIFTLGVALPIFGVRLQDSIERSRCHDDTRLPLVVRDSIDYLQAHGLKSPQLYRTEADKVKMAQLRKLYEDRGTTFPYHWDVPVACNILKTFISELPDSVLTQELSYQFEQATAMAEVQRDAAIAALVAKLPEANRTLLGWIMVHFSEVVALEATNHVSLQVLTSAMGPALGMSANLLAHLVNKADKLFPDVELTRYVPPLDAIPPHLTAECPESVATELRKQESLLSQIHAEMHAGFVTPAREEQLWEGQRIVTQLKRMLRSAQKSLEPTLSMQQPSIDEKQDDEPGPSQGVEPCTSQAQSIAASSDSEAKSPSSTTLASNDAFQPEHKAKDSPGEKKEAFEDDFDLDSKDLTHSETAEDVTDNVQPPSEPVEEKPKLSEKELKLLKLQLENAEYLQLRSLLQAKINSEQFEIVKLRSHMAIKNKLECTQNKENKENAVVETAEDLEIKHKLIKENAALEQKRISLVNQIFQERVACIQLKIELAMKEIL